MRRGVPAALVLAVTAACAGGGTGPGGQAGIAPAPPPEQVGPSGTAPVDVDADVDSDPCLTEPVRRTPSPDRPRYQMSLDIRPAEATVTGTVDVTFVLDFDTDQVAFRLWPNGPRQQAAGALLTVDGPVEIDGQPVATALATPTRLVARPPAGLRAGQPVRAALSFHLRLPQPARDRISAERDSVRLGSFFPILEWEPGRGWTDDPPTTRFAEASTAPTADFDLTITTPPGYTIIASGVQDRPGHWTATAMRDVAVAVGRFTMVTGVVNAPHPVTVTVGVDADAADRPEPYLERSISVLEETARLLRPYPWTTFSVSVTPGTSTGVEYPAHVLHGPGTAGDILTHEVAHQWFYALVGNNQARDPWLDEALTTWAEARYEGTVDAYRATAVPADVRGRTAEPMTFWDQSPSFYLGAYVQGAQALAELGEPDRVDCALRLYAADHAYRIATPADLVASLTRVFPDAAEVLAGYGVRP